MTSSPPNLQSAPNATAPDSRTDLDAAAVERDRQADPQELVEARKAARQRCWLTLTFAAILALLAGIANGESPTDDAPIERGGDRATLRAELPLHSLQYDGFDQTPPAFPSAAGAATFPTGPALNGGAARAATASRPNYVELSARLANFDRDAEPDGWLAEVAILDEHDRLVPMRSRAVFRLMPRIPAQVSGHWLDALPSPLEWSVPLHFNESGTAPVRLPLRASLKPMLGWSETSLIQPRGHVSRSTRRLSAAYGAVRRRSFAITDPHRPMGIAQRGQLSVRVSIPTAGVFEALTTVRIRPQALVDTSWPYR